MSMSYRLHLDETVRHGLKRIVRRQLRRAQQSLRETSEERVHEARKSVKKVRAIVRLLRQTDTAGIGKDARRLRSAGRVLSRLRDADAVLATLDRVRRRFPKRLPEHTAAIIRRELIRTKAQIKKGRRNTRRVAHATRSLRCVYQSLRRWQVPKLGPIDVADLLTPAYRASRKAMLKVRKTTRPSDVHQWRKQVKTVWYQLRLLEERAPSLRTMLQHFERLETVLGEHHDLAVLQAIVARDHRRRRSPEALRQLSTLTHQMQTTLRRQALSQGKRLLDDKPKSFARALRRALSRSSQKSASTARESASAVA
jgi:CHAD domain-containing protein